MSAREIGDELGITRNAVYQQIQALRRKGELAPGYTPSGARRLPREEGLRARSEARQRVSRSVYWMLPAGARKLHAFREKDAVSQCRYHRRDDVVWRRHDISDLCRTCERELKRGA